MMRNLLAGALLAVSMAAPAIATEVDYRAMAMTAVDGQIVPGYQRFARAAGDLDRAAADCSPAAIQPAWRAAMEAWQGVQHITFGPAEGFSRHARVHFWPDKKNTGDRQLALLLRNRDAGPLGNFEMASVAIQGLPALEFLTFGDEAAKLGGGSEDAAFRCRLVRTITGSLNRIGAELLDEWTRPLGFRAAIAEAGEPRSPYTSHEQVASQLFNALHSQLEAIADLKLGYPLGAAPDEARASRAESWRSAQSLANITVDLRELRSLSAGLLQALTAAGKTELAGRVTAGFDRALAAAEAVGGPLETQIATPAGWKRLAALRAEVKALGRLLGDEVAPALNLRIGFNALDGD